MKNFLSAYIFCFAIAFSQSTKADLEKGKWNFVKDDNYCYIGSLPKKTDIPEGKNRGDTYLIVYRINKSSSSIVQIVAGYPFKQNKDVVIKIDKALYNFYSEDDTAWTKDDQAVIYAMKKGIELSVSAESSRGTKTKDIYTLKGFTKAFNMLSNDC